MSINTINVIEVVDGEIVSLNSFPNTEDGIAEAEELFERQMRENWGGEINSGDAEEQFVEELGDALSFDNRFFSADDGDYTVSLVESD